LPVFFALNSRFERSRSVSKGPGSRLLIVTLWRTVVRDTPAMNPVSPVRAPLERPSSAIGAFTAPEVMFTTRPNFLAIMPSTTARIMRIGAIMFASTALTQASRSQSRKSPGGGPPALFTRMSGAGAALRAASRP